MRPPTFLVALLAVTLALSSCLIVQTPGPAFSSEPPGARILVDGRDSGMVTPCMLALDDDVPHVVTLSLEGYEPREFHLEPQGRGWVVHWSQGVTGVRSTTHFPLLMPAWDLLLPLRSARGTTPGRVFARLRPGSAE